MRTDYTLYTLAVAFFIITVASAILFSGAYRLLWAIPFAVLAGISVGVGLSRRPRATEIPTAQPTIPKTFNIPQEITISQQETIATQTQSITEAEPLPQKTEEPPIAMAAQSTATTIAQEAPQQAQLDSNELTQVDGIGEKRAAQLNNIGIKTIADLADASAQDIAEKLKVSSKISNKWVIAAGKLYKKEN